MKQQVAGKSFLPGGVGVADQAAWGRHEGLQAKALGRVRSCESCMDSGLWLRDLQVCDFRHGQM